MKSSNLFEIEFLGDFLPYDSFCSKTNIFHNLETSGFVLLATPLVGAMIADQKALSDFLKEKEFLYEGVSLQVLLWANPKCKPLFDWWLKPRTAIGMEELAEKRVEHLKKLCIAAPDALPLVRNFQVFISFTTPTVSKSVNELERLYEVRRSLMEKLKDMGLGVQILDAQGFLNHFSEIVNLSDTEQFKRRWDKGNELNRQLSNPDQAFKVEASHVDTAYGWRFKTYTPVDFPQSWSLVRMDEFLGNERRNLHFPYLIHYGLTICSGQKREKNKSLGKRESLTESLRSNLAKYLPDLKEKAEEAMVVAEELQRGEQVCYSGLSFCVFSSKEKFKGHESKFLAHMRRLGFELKPALYDHFTLFLSMLPMTWSWGTKLRPFSFWKSKYLGYGSSLFSLKRCKKTLTSEAQNLLPIVGEWTGQNSPGVPLVGRRGQLFFWNPFDVALLPDAKNVQTEGNYNICIAGQSGAGKSVLLQELAANILSVGGKVFAFDYGRSFEKFCAKEQVQGQHITFDLANPISLNFFSHIPDVDLDDKELGETLAAIMSTAKVMASHGEPLNPLKGAYIDEAVITVWKKFGRQGSVHDIRNHLSNHKDHGAREVGQQLFSFSNHGLYGKFFSGASPVDLKDRFVVIETDDLREHPALMAVAVQMMIIRINQMMLGSTKKYPFMIIIDECAALLTGKGSCDFISSATRTSRKYKGSIVLATQHLDDFFKEDVPTASEAFNTSDWKIIMNQPSSSIEGWASHPQLKAFADSEELRDLVKSIHSRPPHYAELGLFNKNIRGVIGRLILDPFSRLLYSTNADEFRLIKELTDKGLGLDAAVLQVAQAQSEAA